MAFVQGALLSSSGGASLCARSRVCALVAPSGAAALRRVPAPRHVRARGVRMSTASTSAPYECETVGEPNTLEFRLVLKQGGNTVSPWHAIPLFANDEKTLLNYINEIPKGTSAKMEIATDEPNTPIKQDVKKGALRFYKYGDSLVNYGALPQTWEDPKEVSTETGFGGDNDPVDLIDLSDTVMPMGAVYPVKVLGVLALLDEGETDWKILAVNAADPKASELNDIADAEKAFPGKVSEVREWFRMYKTAEGKGENEYAFDGEAKGKDFAMKVIMDTHESWRKLYNGETANEDDLWIA
ncbi:Soluble inorganic pyrophosphatase 1, chloroplastic [Porphyridium purpureum]|uniref:inorganic diphosphatase n=1 Tax=Porphyridium purpureum TaxID=35688 RepID=A0A5J4Z4Y5_PORPP|nr:Soluble inorganic pyrophosphatase 1, chloroplastic [Porphyridium purpureum]|eukprot:POR9393..scf295_1